MVASQQSLESGSVPKPYTKCNSVLNVGTIIITCILLQHLWYVERSASPNPSDLISFEVLTGLAIIGPTRPTRCKSFDLVDVLLPLSVTLDRRGESSMRKLHNAEAIHLFYFQWQLKRSPSRGD